MLLEHIMCLELLVRDVGLAQVAKEKWPSPWVLFLCWVSHQFSLNVFPHPSVSQTKGAIVWVCLLLKRSHHWST